jgi:hypothetical protein
MAVDVFRQERPYNDDNTASRPLCEVKHRLAWLVSGTTVGDQVGIPGVILFSFTYIFLI